MLTDFWTEIFTSGTITWTRPFSIISENDNDACCELFRKTYDENRLEIPSTAPDFAPEAALWAATFMYHATDLLVQRDKGEDAITGTLQQWHKAVDPSVIISVDLAFRYLPSLLNLARGLAPADWLVKILTDTATAWPFSAVSLFINPDSLPQPIIAHPSLRGAYIDRVIAEGKEEMLKDSILSPYLPVLFHHQPT